uniref:21.5 kDa small heat shock protein n=1 Tax=Choristoneura fumiferana TaxID=7141 RepID=Q1AMF7_CHOFU|nr:21.5 kDa small heat shock protein [Choristoneura fumiferana]
MSLLPYLLDDWGYSRPRHHHHHHYPNQLQHTILPLLAEASYPLALNRDYYRPWRQLAAAARDCGSSIKVDKDKFQIDLDVQHFKPEEISVKTVDGYIVVEGKHEEKKDEHGFISRQFTRRYALPEGTAPESVESKLSSDGVLSVIAPRKVPDAIKGERNVTITQTGPVRKEIKDQSEGTEKNEKEEK